jgi:hypothetical protein
MVKFSSIVILSFALTNYIYLCKWESIKKMKYNGYFMSVLFILFVANALKKKQYLISSNSNK